jgi:cyclase
MLQTRVIPTLLLKGRGLVKGIRFKDHRYIGDPINAVHIFNAREADELVFLDISATSENRLPDLNHIQQIADECYMPFAVGGGIRKVEDIRAILNAGAEKVVINTAVAENPNLIRAASQVFGNQCIIVSIDARKKLLGGYETLTHCGTKKTGKDPVELAKLVAESGAGEILLTSVDCEGSMNGYDLELTKKVSAALDIPVIASGGAGNIQHISEAIHSGAQAVAAGSMFVFHGRRRAVLISYPDKTQLVELFK